MKKQIYNKTNKIAIITIFSILLLATIAGAITISQMQTKLSLTPGITNVTQISPNKLQFTYTGIVSKMQPYFNITLNQTVQRTLLYNGTQQYNLTIINPKSIRIIINKQNLTLI